ncbi:MULTISPECIES: hypothetical protein [unclassified Serratia (in: enterobacteria)]|uniref:hypothetical protein n=1 Tax=unclassified Serratia (in: enterobacteria) TaxID=2647522 RepID=UPI0018A8C46A|nr:MULTISPECIES: hypothetical protein [unclassified Serratia (in: enterobacteria)]
MVNFHAGIGKNLFCGTFILLSTAPYLHSDFVIDIDFQHIALIQLFTGVGADTVYHVDKRYLAIRSQAGRDCGRLMTGRTDRLQ